VIVVGNEKGGSGKSTVALHVAVGLLRLGYRVGTIDLDSHQGTLTSAMKNRWRSMTAEEGAGILMPEHVHIDRADDLSDAFARRDAERWRVETVIDELAAGNDFLVIDTPGSDRFLSVVGHSYADTLITPINDSFVDLDLITKVDADTLKAQRPGVYTEMVWDLTRQRQKRDGRTINWFVMRNRLGADTLHKQDVARMVADLQRPLGFTEAPGFSEREVFRQLFLHGLTLLDLREGSRFAERYTLDLASINARQEVRNLVRMILPQKEVSTLSLLRTA
jgi:chromosome partitioning protein